MMVRRAQEKDIPVLLQLLTQVNMVHHNIRPDLFKGPATKYSYEDLKSILQNEKTPVFVYTDETGTVKGYAFCIFVRHADDSILTDIKTLYIDDLCVDEHCRGQHIGQALFDHVIRFAREQHCYNLTLNVWAGNDSAMRFYEKSGLKTQKTGMEMIL